jgi:hypothetical protein
VNLCVVANKHDLPASASASAPSDGAAYHM